MRDPGDPAFSSAVERAYLRALSQISLDQDRPTILALHEELLEQAIFSADHSSGGLRFKSLPNKLELESRLLDALRRALIDE